MSLDWSEFTAKLGAMLFVAAAFYLLFLPRQMRFSRRAWPAWAVVAAFLGAILWSMWSETLRPLVQSGETVRAARTAAGLLVILLAVVVITYGGFRVFAQIMTAMHTETFAHNAEIGRAGTKQYSREVVRAARRENLSLVFRAAYPGLAWMALAFGLLALGGWLGR